MRGFAGRKTEERFEEDVATEDATLLGGREGPAWDAVANDFVEAGGE